MPTTKETAVLLQTLQNPSTSEESAVDAIVEYIQGRRRKSGWGIWDVTLSLGEVLQKAPPHLDECFEIARTRCHLPHHTDLTPPTTMSTPVRSRSTTKNAMVVTQTLRGFLAEEITLGQVREVLAEWTAGLEIKLGEGEATDSDGSAVVLAPGGKGSVGSAGFGELVKSYTSLSSGLPKPLDPSLSALLLSIRLSMGYLTFSELQTQLTIYLGLREGEECLRIWVGRRIQGDGRWAMGNTLDELIRLTEKVRPALKGVVRMVKRKYLLPLGPTEERSKVPLPAPNKARVVALLTSHRAATNSLANLRRYAFEVCSEFLTREKRDSMRAEKWSKSGRKQLSRDLDEIEDRIALAAGPPWSLSSSLSPGGLHDDDQQEDDVSAGLLPTFEVLRRIYVLDPAASRASTTSTGHFQPITIPDENEAYLPPTVQTITSALYVDPRLSTGRAVEVVMELVDYEKDLRMMDVRGAMTAEEEAAEAERRRTSEETVMSALVWGPLEKSKMRQVLESIERRFPGGEYDEAFEVVRFKVSEGADLARAPSYTTVASIGTAQRTDSYLRGSSHARGSASMSNAGLPPVPTLPPFSFGSRPLAEPEQPPLMEVLEAESPPLSATIVPERARYQRTNTTPNERIPGMLGQAMRKMSLSNRELSSIASGDSSAGSPSRSNRTVEQVASGGMVHSNSQTSVGTAGTLDDIYAGYGDDEIQPRTPVEDVQQMPSVGSQSGQRIALGTPLGQAPYPSRPSPQVEPPAKPKRKGSILRRPGFLGGGSKADKGTNENSSSLGRSAPRHRPSMSLGSGIPPGNKSAAAAAAIMAGTSTPPRTVGDTSVSSDTSSATSSPAGWRAEFNNMNNGMSMLRPAPKHSTSSSLSNSPTMRQR